MEKLRPFASTNIESVEADIILLPNQIVELKFNFPAGTTQAQPSSQPQRRNELWKSTCFEAFIQPKGAKTYWEINLSPEGHWNVYSFDDYRTPSPPKEASKWKLVEFQLKNSSLLGRFRADFGTAKKFQAGLCCIIDMPKGEKTYWAIQHSKDKPDYHNNKNFILEREIL